MRFKKYVYAQAEKTSKKNKPETRAKISGLLKFSDKSMPVIAKECGVDPRAVSRTNRDEGIRPKGYLPQKTHPMEWHEKNVKAAKAIKDNPEKPLAVIARELGVTKSWLTYFNSYKKIRSKYENAVFKGGNFSPINAFKLLRQRNISEQFFSKCLKYYCETIAAKLIAKHPEVVKGRKTFFTQKVSQGLYDWLIEVMVSGNTRHLSSRSPSKAKTLLQEISAKQERNVSLRKTKPAAEKRVPKRFTREDLVLAVNSLTERQRKVVTGMFFESKTQLQIAKELGITSSAVSTHYLNALSKLRKKLFEEKHASMPHDEALKLLTKIFKQAE